MEELQVRHRKEQRDLQSRITQKKKSATKKTRKAANDECERWQRELQERQQAEIAELNGDVNTATESLDCLHVEDDDDSSVPLTTGINADTNSQLPAQSTQSTTTANTSSASPPFQPQSQTQDQARTKKPNRQKARLARRAAEREADAEAAASEAANQIDHRSHEKEAMQAAFTRLGLKERDVAPDGHCLYSAVAMQLAEVGVPVKVGTANETKSATAPATDAYRAVREATGRFVMAHEDDFAPFVEEPLDKYARKIMATAEWGGQLELQAMAKVYGVQINVLQGDGRIEKFEPDNDAGDEMEKKKIWLAYYRHSYGLGEHYNALTKAA